QIAHANGDFVGYDAGDADHAIPPLALTGVTWHDLMTYCDHQWLSGYTYGAIYHRLIAEDALPAPVDPGGGGGPGAGRRAGRSAAMPDQPGGIHVVARVNE